MPVSAMVFGFFLITTACLGAHGRNARCSTYGGYRTEADGKFKCLLYNPSWETVTAFELEYKHCLKTTTISLFVRNFQSVDEINHDFVKAERTLRFKSFTGKTSKFITKFQTIKEDKKNGVRKQLRVMIYFQPNTKGLRIENLLTASFDMDDTDDCNFLDRLELFHRVFLGIGLCVFFTLVLVIFLCVRKRRRMGPQKTSPPTYFQTASLKEVDPTYL